MNKGKKIRSSSYCWFGIKPDIVSRQCNPLDVTSLQEEIVLRVGGGNFFCVCVCVFRIELF